MEGGVNVHEKKLYSNQTKQVNSTFIAVLHLDCRCKAFNDEQKPISYSKIKTAPSVHMSGITCYLSITATYEVIVKTSYAGASIN